MKNFILNKMIPFFKRNWLITILIIIVTVGVIWIYSYYKNVKPLPFINLAFGASLAFALGAYEFIDDYRTGQNRSRAIAMISLATLGFLYSIFTSTKSADETESTKGENLALQLKLDTLDGKVDTLKLSQKDAEKLLTDLKNASANLQTTSDLIKDRTNRHLYITDSTGKSEMSKKKEMESQKMESAYQLLIWTYDEQLHRLNENTSIQLGLQEFTELLNKMKSVVSGELGNSLMISNPYIKPAWIWFNRNLTGWLADKHDPKTIEDFKRKVNLFIDVHCYFKKQIFSYYALNNESLAYDAEAKKRVSVPKWGIKVEIKPFGLMDSIPKCGSITE